MCRRPGRKIWRHWAARAAMSPSRCRWQDPRERMNRYTRGQFHCRSCRRQARCGCNRLTGLHSGYTFRAYPPSLWPAKANLQGSRELVEGGVALFPYRRKAPAHCPRSPSDINPKNIRMSTCDVRWLAVTSMVSFADCQAEGRRSNHVVDIVDFLFLLLL